LDRATMTTQQIQEELDRAIKLSRTNTITSTEFTTSASDRANKVLAFDSSGELSVTQELGTFKGTDATVTTAAYVQRDIIKSTTTAQLNNVYICVADSVVGDSLTDTDHFELLVDAVSAATSATNAATSATASASSATAAASSATSAATQASNASTSASTASTQATNAANSATAAASSATSAANSLDTFDDTYLGAKSSDPSTDNDGDALAAGMLYTNTTTGNLKFYNGTAWINISTGLTSIAADTTPQLGGNLDTNDKEIVTVSNRNLILAPNGTGMLEVKGNDNAGQIQLNCEQNSHGVKIKGPPHSAGQSYTLTLPSSIVNGQFLKTDGSGNLSFADSATLPTITTTSLTTTPSTSTAHTIDGTGFVSVPIVEFIKSDTGAITRASAVSFTSSTRVTATVSLAAGTYFVRVENNDGGAVRTSTAILTVSTGPSWTTSAGSLGTVGAGDAVSFTVAATSDSTIAFSETTSILTSNSDTPATTMNLSLNSSTGAITGTAPSPTATTTYTFTLRATDDESQTADREFSITVSVAINNGGQFN